MSETNLPEDLEFTIKRRNGTYYEITSHGLTQFCTTDLTALEFLREALDLPKEIEKPKRSKPRVSLLIDGAPKKRGRKSKPVLAPETPVTEGV